MFKALSAMLIQMTKKKDQETEQRSTTIKHKFYDCTLTLTIFFFFILVKQCKTLTVNNGTHYDKLCAS